MKIELVDGMVYDSEEGKDICKIDCLGEVAEIIITELINERDNLLDTILLKDDRIEELENLKEMYEDNWGIEE